MPVLRRLSVSSVVPALAVTMALVAACSSKTSPAPAGTAGTFCQAATAWTAKCGEAGCDGDLATDCEDYSSSLNSATLDYARDCLENAADCVSTPSGCLAGAITATHATLPAGLSTNLAPGTASCLETAFTSSSDAGGGGDDDGGATGDASTDATSGDDGGADGSSDASGGDGSTSDSGTGDGGTGEGGTTCGDKYEPDNTPDTAYSLAQVEDDDAPVTISASISVPGQDEDWYTYPGDDKLDTVGKMSPYAELTTIASTMQVCVWAKENNGDSIASGCQAGVPTDFPTQGLGYVGCCSNGGSTVQMNQYGSDFSTDSSTVQMRVSMPASASMCVAYQLAYAFAK